MSDCRNDSVNRNRSKNAEVALPSSTSVMLHDKGNEHAMQLSPIRSRRSAGAEFASAAESDDKLHMKKEIGLFSGVSIISGIIIGSGIFLTPAGIVEKTGSTGMAILVWIFCGLLSTIGAICYAELGTAIPRSGGDYEYIREGLGNMPSFVYLWSAIVTILPAGNAVIAFTFAENMLQSLKMIKPKDATYGSSYNWSRRMLAFLCISMLTYINCRNVKLVTRVQTVFTLAKLAALFFIIVSGLAYLIFGKDAHNAVSFDDTESVGNIAMSFYIGLFSYSGWNYLNFLTEEIKQPLKNLPRAIYISLPLVTAVYVLTNIAYFSVLSVKQMTDSPATAVLFTSKLFDERLGNEFLSAVIMPILIACSCFGAVNGTLLSSSRLFFIGARNGHLPDLLALVNVNHLTPIPAVLCVGSISILLLFVPGKLTDLLSVASVVECLSQATCIFTLLYLRYKRPDIERPIRVNILLPVTFLLVAIFLFSVSTVPKSSSEDGASAWTDFFVVLIALGIISVGMPIYWIMFYVQRRRVVREASEGRMISTKSSATCFVQKLTFAAQEQSEYD